MMGVLIRREKNWARTYTEKQLSEDGQGEGHVTTGAGMRAPAKDRGIAAGSP